VRGNHALNKMACGKIPVPWATATDFVVPVLGQDPFAQRGSIVSFRMEQSRVRFDINLTAAERDRGEGAPGR
jgi:hypothetical protein